MNLTKKIAGIGMSLVLSACALTPSSNYENASPRANYDAAQSNYDIRIDSKVGMRDLDLEERAWVPIEGAYSGGGSIDGHPFNFDYIEDERKNIWIYSSERTGEAIHSDSERIVTCRSGNRGESNLIKEYCLPEVIEKIYQKIYDAEAELPILNIEKK